MKMKKLFLVVLLMFCFKCISYLQNPKIEISITSDKKHEHVLLDKSGKQVANLKEFKIKGVPFSVVVKARPAELKTKIENYEFVLILKNGDGPLALTTKKNLPSHFLTIDPEKDNTFEVDATGKIKNTSIAFAFTDEIVEIVYNADPIVDPDPPSKSARIFTPTPADMARIITEEKVRSTYQNALKAEKRKQYLVFDFEKMELLNPTSEKVHLHYLKDKNHLYFKIINYPPFLNYDFEVKVSGETIFQQGKEAFAVNQEQNNNSDEQSGTGGNQAQSDGSEEIDKVYKRLKDELSAYYQKNKSNSNLVQMQVELEVINDKITKKLGLTTCSKDAILTKGKADLEKIKGNNDKYFASLSYLRDAADLYQKIGRAAYNSKTMAGPIQSRDFDIIKIDWTIKDGDDFVYKRAEPYEVYVCKRWKWDISTGFIGTNVVDQQFFLKPQVSTHTTTVDVNGIKEITTTEVTEHKIVKSDVGDYKVGLSLLANFYQKSCNSPVSWGISTGLSAKFDDSKVRPLFLLGPSIMIGKKRERLVLSGGIAVGPTQQLQSSYAENNLLTFENNQPVEVPYRQTWEKPGFFIGITYNMLNPKK